jgi:hypothetical protein
MVAITEVIMEIPIITTVTTMHLPDITEMADIGATTAIITETTLIITMIMAFLIITTIIIIPEEKYTWKEDLQ